MLGAERLMASNILCRNRQDLCVHTCKLTQFVVVRAQFAQNEGTELIKRAFNPKLSPEINRKRLQRLFTQMRLAGEQRKAMVEHFNTNGTLQGYTGRDASATDFYTAIEGQAPAAGGALPVINNQGSYDALPSGAKYTSGDGITRTKP